MFPVELVDTIVDYLHNDKASIVSCSLVSKTWAISSRYHLFRIVFLRRGPDDDGIDRFLRFIHSPWGNICCPFVRQLRITGHMSHNVLQLDPIIDLHTLGAVVNMLPRLEALELKSVAWPGLEAGSSAPPTSASVKSLTVTHLSMWVFSSVEDVMDIFHVFPNLRAIRTHDIIWRHPCRTKPARALRRPYPTELRLEAIVFRACTGITWSFIEFAQRALNFEALTSLSIWQLEVGDIKALGNFLREVGGTLRYLHLKLSQIRFIDGEAERMYPQFISCRFFLLLMCWFSTASPEEIWPLLNLSDCTALDTFSLFVPMDDDPLINGPAIDFVPYWDSVLLILVQLPLSIKGFRIGLEVLDEDFLEELLLNLDWDWIDAHLQLLPELKTVRFFRESRWEENLQEELPAWIENSLSRWLPMLKATDILRF